MRYGVRKRRGGLGIGIGISPCLGGGVLFTPATLTGLSQWLNPSAGVFQDAARTTPATADGQFVGGWADQSTGGRHASQGTAGFRPTLRLGAQNGQPVIRFDGADDTLLANGVGTLLTGSDVPFTWFAAFKKAGAAGSHQLFSLYNSGGGSRLHRVLIDATGGLYDIFRRDDGGGSKTRDGGTPDTSWHTLIQVFTGTQVSLYLDGAAVSLTGTDLDVGALTLDSFSLGANQGVGEFLNGDFGDNGIYNVALSAASVAQLQAYLKAKWGTP